MRTIGRGRLVLMLLLVLLLMLMLVSFKLLFHIANFFAKVTKKFAISKIKSTQLDCQPTPRLLGAKVDDGVDVRRHRRQSDDHAGVG